MMKIRKYVGDLCLITGENHRGNCPVCGGRNTFTATNDNGVVKYNCYKNTCTIGGFIHTDLTAAEIMMLMRQTAEQKRHREKETMEIPQYVVKPMPTHVKFNRFVRRWGLAIDNLLYDVKDERVVFPIHHKGRMVDAIGRAVGNTQHPKWYRYTGKADYYTIGTGSVLFIVEDVVSAIVAYQEFPHITSMAILGTQLTDKHMEKIGEYDRVVIALDPDAIDKTIKYRSEIQAWTGLRTMAYMLNDDVKYIVEDDMEKLEGMLRND
jgi:hypothetical protein